LNEEKIQLFRKEIIYWFNKFGESFPWRDTSDPWHILIAAIMLRKTTTKQVNKIFPTFIKQFPNSYTVKDASIEFVEEQIKSLGLEKRRAKEIKMMAEVINTRYNGRVPSAENDLLSIPGVGKYIASEVMLSAFKKKKPLLDTNMIRVINRVFGYKSERKRPREDKELWIFAEKLVPKEATDARRFNYGVLDFARLICKAQKPLCPICTLNDMCIYYSEIVCI
jgi:A/G-specific adenine glycosylase